MHLFLKICLLVTACDPIVTGVEIIQYPDKLIYIVGVDDSLDLTGGIVNYKYKKGGTESEMEDDSYENYTISHNIDFYTPGVYKVNLLARGDKSMVLDKFAIQVIDEQAILELLGRDTED